MYFFNIADLNIAIDSPEWLIHERFKAFKSSMSNFDLHYKISFNPAPAMPTVTKPLMLKIYANTSIDNNGCIHVVNFEKSDIPYYTVISKGWSDCSLYIDPSYNDQTNSKNSDYVKDCLLSQFRKLFIPFLMLHDGALTHSASIEFNGNSVLFCAPAGTGKTTHVRLWKERYNVQVLDGDVTACRMIDGVPYAYGLPWCGSSGEFLNKRLPLQSIVFLEQSETNAMTKLDFAEAIIRLYARCFLYLSDESVTDQVLKTIQDLVGCVDCYLLKCRPDYEAVELVKQCLE